MWQILIKMALPMLIRGLQGRIGKEAMDVLNAAIVGAVTKTLGSGKEREAEVWAVFYVQVAELKLAIAEEISAGVPWYLNLALEALVAQTKLKSDAVV